MQSRSFWLFTGLLLIALNIAAPKTIPSHADLMHTLEVGLHRDDLALIKAAENNLSPEQLSEIQRFTSDPSVIADSRRFVVSTYSGWDDYNYQRPIGDAVMAVLARRDLFLDPARQLNNRALTNMSPEALVALAFSQVYVEEKWDHEAPWDGDPNPYFNWVHPDVIGIPDMLRYINGDYLYQARVESWWVTYWSSAMGFFAWQHVGRGTDNEAALIDIHAPIANVPRLSGYGYPVGNQLFLQTAETVYWYADYLKYGAQRYGVFDSQHLDTRIHFPEGAAQLWESRSPEITDDADLLALLDSPFGADLRRELQAIESSAFWNVMRFVYAGARQREGGGSLEHPENGQPAIIALRYEERASLPVGRQPEEVSAFALLTTVYSDSILLDFTNWDFNRQMLLVPPVDESRTDNLHRQVSERNKAIRVVEQMGSENFYPNATHVAGSRGLGFNLITQYQEADGDFLPYAADEAYALVMALWIEAGEYDAESSRYTLCNSPLLKLGYEQYQLNHDQVPDWETITTDLCAL